jgi:hypothetical protein
MTKRTAYALYAVGLLCATSGLASAHQGMDAIHKENGDTSIQLVRQQSQSEIAKYKAVKRFMRYYR